MKKISIAFGVFVLLLLAACGFKPRGAVPQVTLDGPVQIVGVEKYSPLHKALVHQLKRAGVQVVEQSATALTLRIRDLRSTSRLLTVNSKGDSVERELGESFKFTLRHPQQGDLIKEQTLRVLRILYQPEEERLGSDNEAERLREDMHRQLARQLLRRLQAVR